MLSHGHWDHAGGLTKAFDLIVKAKGFKFTENDNDNDVHNIIGIMPGACPKRLT